MLRVQSPVQSQEYLSQPFGEEFEAQSQAGYPIPQFDAEIVGEGLIQADLGAAALIMAIADEQYQDYVRSLPESQRKAALAAEARGDNSAWDAAWKAGKINTQSVLLTAKATYEQMMGYHAAEQTRRAQDDDEFDEAGNFAPFRSTKSKRKFQD